MDKLKKFYRIYKTKDKKIRKLGEYLANRKREKTSKDEEIFGAKMSLLNKMEDSLVNRIKKSLTNTKLIKNPKHPFCGIPTEEINNLVYNKRSDIRFYIESISEWLNDQGIILFTMKHHRKDDTNELSEWFDLLIDEHKLREVVDLIYDKRYAKNIERIEEDKNRLMFFSFSGPLHVKVINAFNYYCKRNADNQIIWKKLPIEYSTKPIFSNDLFHYLAEEELNLQRQLYDWSNK